MQIYEDAPKGVSFQTQTPVAPRSGRKPLGRHNFQGTPHQKSKKDNTELEANNNNRMKTPIGVRKGGTTTTAQPASAQSFRRALRQSLSPPPGAALVPKSHNKPAAVLPKVSFFPEVTGGDDDDGLIPRTADRVDKVEISKPSISGGLSSKRISLGGLGPPQRVQPKTPNSLLRTEMDDSTSDLEDSLLVSPPGAVRNALDVTHNPSSASSTSLLIVPPATAATIHTIASSQKKAKQIQLQPWRSPPLQPRSLLATMPEERNKTNRGGIAMDLSTMFSREKKSPPPQHLLERLQKPVGSKQKASPPQSTSENRFFSLSSPPPRVWKQGFEDRRVVERVVEDLVEPVQPLLTPANTRSGTPIAGGIGASSDKIPEDKPKTTETTLIVGPTTKLPFTAPHAPTPTATFNDDVLTKSQSKGGISMDMSNLFSDTARAKVVQSTPPAHLLERLARKTAPKIQTAPDANKKSGLLRPKGRVTTSKSSSVSLKAKPMALATKPEATKVATKKTVSVAKRQVVSIKSNEIMPRRANSKKEVSGTEALNPSMQPESFSRPVATTKNPATSRTGRAPLEKNDKFFPTSEVASTPTTKGKGVAFVIAPPNEEAIYPVAKRKTTPVNNSDSVAHKAKSPLKITRDANDWAGKQCDTFASWLNYTFHPDEEEDDSISTSGLRALVMHRRLAQVRYRAAELFQGPVMRKVRDEIKSEISRGRLTLRKDRDLNADLSLRKLATKLLLSYTTPWLRLALEIMFGESIPLADVLNDDLTPVARMRLTLRDFVVERVLSDASVLMKYTKGRTNVPSGKFEKLYREEMRTLVLYRLMTLILFLDHLKTENVLDKVPRLFTKSSDVKSSRAVLLSFCRNFLSSEGDFMKHLSRIGLTVSYVQDPIDELEFNVTNLAADLRDGGKLTRMAEIITGSPFKTSMRSLRLPAVSRLQKMHNVNIAFAKLKTFGVVVPHDLSAHHIVDAHREMVLKLIWSVIAHVCMNKLLEEGQVEHEIENVLRSGKARRQIEGLKARSPQRFSPDKVKASSPEDALKSLLFRWCKAVCFNFGLVLEDFSESFADGKALCYLVHYYHPGTLRCEDILPTTADIASGISVDQALANERMNSAKAARCVTELGGIPKMLPITDSQNPPDEKSMLLCLTYLCSRLMESSEEIFATILIQAGYRRYRKKVIQEKKENAARVIFRVWCAHKDQYYAAQQRRYAEAVASIETFVCQHRHALKVMKLERLERELQTSSAILIQKWYRRTKSKKREQSAIIIQKYCRRFMAELDALEASLERSAACKVQSIVRAYLARHHFISTLRCASKIQRVTRGFFVRKHNHMRTAAAVVIQRAWFDWLQFADQEVAAILLQKAVRGRLARRRYTTLQVHSHAATVIQKNWRRYVQFATFQISIQFAMAIQKVARGFLTRKSISMLRMSRAAILIQKIWRRFSTQVQFNMDILDIIAVQSLVRSRQARKEVGGRSDALSCLQRAVRCFLARRARVCQYAARTIQCSVRMWTAKRQLLMLMASVKAATSIQSNWRRHCCQQDFQNIVRSAVVMQSLIRGFFVRRRQTSNVLAVCKIQKAFRAHSHQKLEAASATVLQSIVRRNKAVNHFKMVRSASIKLQSILRCVAARQRYRDTRLAIIVIQCSWRRFSAKLNFELDVLEVVICQSVVRRKLAQIESSRRSESIQILQNFFRQCLAVAQLVGLKRQHQEGIRRNTAATYIQRRARTFVAQIILRRRIDAITKFQAIVRMSKRRREFSSLQGSCVVLQSTWRAFIARKAILMLHQAATQIQATWRGHVNFVDFAICYGSVVICQSYARRFLAQKTALGRRQALIKIQSCARRRIAIKISQAKHELQRISHLEFQASTAIQSLYRGSSVRQEFRLMKMAVTLIQAHYRRRIVRVLFELEMYDIKVVQAMARRWLACQAVSRQFRNIVVVQSLARAWMARRARDQLLFERRLSYAQEMAETRIASVYRGYLVRRNINVLHYMSTRIQAAFRGHYCYVSYNMQLVDIIIVQNQARLWLVRKLISAQKKSACKIQTVVRRRLASTRVNKLRLIKKMQETEDIAAGNIQRLWRGKQSRRISRRHSSARKIQKTWRCFAAHVDYLLQQISLIRIQSFVRMRQAKESYRATRNGIICFQASYRGFACREHIRFISLSATVLQASIRRHLCRKHYRRRIGGVVVLQSRIRGAAVREEIDLWHFAAAEIQRVWRGFAQFSDYFIHIEAAVKLQSFVRRVNARRRYHDLRQAVMVEHRFYSWHATNIQRFFRAYLRLVRASDAATLIQRQARTFIHTRRAAKVNRGVKILQAAFRANVVRRSRSKRVKAVAARLNAANDKARRDPKLRIGYKTRHALEVLQNSKSLAGIMDAAKTLETSTRLSQLCCILFTEAGAARILLDLIRSCNRSVPHVELVQCILLTLDNVSQYRKLVPSIADCTSAEVFLDKMQMFRDKDGIFCLSISLLQRISECNPIVEEYCAMHEHLKRLKALYQLSMRRAKPQHFDLKGARHTNRMKRREIFDRHGAVKVLGALTEKFEVHSLVASPSAVQARQHFTF